MPSVPTEALAGDSDAMLALATAAVSTGRYEDAVAILNQLLNLPPNATSQQAQELIGIAREGLGENQRALAEYELYVKLYPDSPRIQRVKERITALKVAASAPKARSEEHTSELQSLMRISYAVFCLKKKN